jgi:hypothetical protein
MPTGNAQEIDHPRRLTGRTRWHGTRNGATYTQDTSKKGDALRG